MCPRLCMFVLFFQETEKLVDQWIVLLSCRIPDGGRVVAADVRGGPRPRGFCWKRHSWRPGWELCKSNIWSSIDNSAQFHSIYIWKKRNCIIRHFTCWNAMLNPCNASTVWLHHDPSFIFILEYKSKMCRMKTNLYFRIKARLHWCLVCWNIWGKKNRTL